jgi:hypothetical protein
LSCRPAAAAAAGWLRLPAALLLNSGSSGNTWNFPSLQSSRANQHTANEHTEHDHGNLIQQQQMTWSSMHQRSQHASVVATYYRCHPRPCTSQDSNQTLSRFSHAGQSLPI